MAARSSRSYLTPGWWHQRFARQSEGSPIEFRNVTLEPLEEK